MCVSIYPSTCHEIESHMKRGEREVEGERDRGRKGEREGGREGEREHIILNQ